MTFEQYIEQQIPGYLYVLDPNKIKELNDLYDKTDSFMKAASYCLQNQGKSNIDYTIDYEKNMTNATNIELY